MAARPQVEVSLAATRLSLDEALVAEGTRWLGDRDQDLAGIVTNFGLPPFWQRDPGFPTLVLLVLEQQVSLASAKVAYERLLAATGSPLRPEPFLKLDGWRLKRVGFSRQKAGYCRLLAQSILERRLDLEAIAKLDDESARAELTRIKGIGPWTADVYLLMALCRPDVWPVGDLALQKSVQRVKRLRKHPTPARLEKIGEAWRPWRAVAARLLWHDYLSRIAAKKTAASKNGKEKG